MFERDYLMRLLAQLFEGIARSLELARGKGSPKAAADALEQTIAQATDIDGGILLGLSPDSIADILQVSGTDPGVVEFVSRSLLLAAEYLNEAGDAALASLRRAQACALVRSFGLDVDVDAAPENEMDAYMERMRG